MIKSVSVFEYGVSKQFRDYVAHYESGYRRTFDTATKKIDEFLKNSDYLVTLDTDRIKVTSYFRKEAIA